MTIRESQKHFCVWWMNGVLSIAFWFAFFCACCGHHFEYWTGCSCLVSVCSSTRPVSAHTSTWAPNSMMGRGMGAGWWSRPWGGCSVAVVHVGRLPLSLSLFASLSLHSHGCLLPLAHKAVQLVVCGVEEVGVLLEQLQQLVIHREVKVGPHARRHQRLQVVWVKRRGVIIMVEDKF